MSPHFHLYGHRTMTPALVAAVLLAAAVAAPASSSVPAVPGAAAATAALVLRPLPGPPTTADVNVATGAVRRPADATGDQGLRSSDARDAAIRSAAAREQDLRHLRAGGEPARSSLPGPPTWPTHPQPITAAPAARVTDDPNGLNWTMIGLGIAGSLLAVGGIVALTGRRRVQRLRATP